jgi:hypothetical protein
MLDQVHVVKQRGGRRFSVVKHALAALCYLVTGSVALVLALLLVLLIVELGAAIGAALEHDMPASIVAENPLRAQSPQRKEFLWRVGVEVRFVYDRAGFGSATL